MSGSQFESMFHFCEHLSAAGTGEPQEACDQGSTLQVSAGTHSPLEVGGVRGLRPPGAVPPGTAGASAIHSPEDLREVTGPCSQ